VAGVLDYQLRD